MVRIAPDGPGENFLAGAPAIHVHLTTLASLADTLQAQLDADLLPYTGRLYARYGTGASFGSRTPSADVRAAALAYHTRVGEVVRQLAGYLDRSSILIDAARLILRGYGQTDAMAKVNAQQAAAALDQATSQVVLGHHRGHGPDRPV